MLPYLFYFSSSFWSPGLWWKLSLGSSQPQQGETYPTKNVCPVHELRATESNFTSWSRLHVNSLKLTLLISSPQDLDRWREKASSTFLSPILCFQISADEGEARKPLDYWDAPSHFHRWWMHECQATKGEVVLTCCSAITKKWNHTFFGALMPCPNAHLSPMRLCLPMISPSPLPTPLSPYHWCSDSILYTVLFFWC